MKIRITKVLPTSSHFGDEKYNLVGCVGVVDEISETEVFDEESEYFGKLVNFVIVHDCQYEDERLSNGDTTIIFGAEYEVIEE